MVKRKLVMTFINESGEKASITIDDPREDLAHSEVKEAMDDILAKNIFHTSGGDIVKVDSARIVETVTAEFDYSK